MELHDQPEDQEEHGHEAEVGLAGRVQVELARDLEAGQELHGVGQGDVGDRQAEHEEDDRERDQRQHAAPLALRQAGCHEGPQLVEDHRQADDDAGHDRDLDVQQEAGAEREELDLAAATAVQRLEQQGDHVLCLPEADDATERDGHDSDEDSPAELREVLHQRHHRRIGGFRGSRGRCGRRGTRRIR